MSLELFLLIGALTEEMGRREAATDGRQQARGYKLSRHLQQSNNVRRCEMAPNEDAYFDACFKRHLSFRSHPRTFGAFCLAAALIRVRLREAGYWRAGREREGGREGGCKLRQAAVLIPPPRPPTEKDLLRTTKPPMGASD